MGHARARLTYSSDVARLLPVSWLFFKAVRAGLAVANDGETVHQSPATQA